MSEYYVEALRLSVLIKKTIYLLTYFPVAMQCGRIYIRAVEVGFKNLGL